MIVIPRSRSKSILSITLSGLSRSNGKYLTA
jgi:hypothetical protein